MYCYSMRIACDFTIYLIFVASYTASGHLCICCVFEPKLLTNQEDDVTNCVFGLVTRFWPSSKKDQILSGKLANSNGRNFTSFYQNSLKLSI